MADSDGVPAIKKLYWRWHNRLHPLVEPLRLTRFWVKTLLYRYTPNGYGYYRRLHEQKDPDYNHERDKSTVRHKHYGDQGWNEKPEGRFRYRNYDSYDEYITHQKEKWREILLTRGGFTNREVMDYRRKFLRRFRRLPTNIPRDGAILCMGARQGTEVEVLQDIGYVNAYGIDLNPGPDNPWVRPGDFMKLQETDSSLDLVYTNAVDHVYNLELFLAEQLRVIKPNGYALYDLVHVSEEKEEQAFGVFEAVEWADDNDLIMLLLKYFKTIVHIETEEDWKFILLRGPRK